MRLSEGVLSRVCCQRMFGIFLCNGIAVFDHDREGVLSEDVLCEGMFVRVYVMICHNKIRQDDVTKRIYAPTCV